MAGKSTGLKRLTLELAGKNPDSMWWRQELAPGFKFGADPWTDKGWRLVEGASDRVAMVVFPTEHVVKDRAWVVLNPVEYGSALNLLPKTQRTLGCQFRGGEVCGPRRVEGVWPKVLEYQKLATLDVADRPLVEALEMAAKRLREPFDGKKRDWAFPLRISTSVSGRVQVKIVVPNDGASMVVDTRWKGETHVPEVGIDPSYLRMFLEPGSEIDLRVVREGGRFWVIVVPGRLPAKAGVDSNWLGIISTVDLEVHDGSFR
jgi:hypothetical protein